MKVLLIDGNSLLHRAFHALPDSLSTSSGQPTNAVYGLAQMLLVLLEEHCPQAALVAFDAPGKTFRHELYPEYKADRPPMDEALASQLELTHELVDSFGLQQVEAAGYEADDIIATMAQRAAQAGEEVLIVSGDRDLLQLVDENISVLATLRGLTETRLYDSQQVKQEYKVSPDQITDYKALVGDKSDNIPGARGIGPKTAEKLLSRFPDIEDLLARLSEIQPESLAEKLKDCGEQLRLSKDLATVVRDVPVELELDSIGWEGIPAGKLRELFVRLEFVRLLDRIPTEDISAGDESLTQMELDEIVEQARSAGYCNVVAIFTDEFMQGLAVGVDDIGVVYLELTGGEDNNDKGSLFETAESQRVPAAVADLLTDSSIGKRGCHLKRIAAGLDKFGIRLAGCQWDGAVADYLIAPQRKQNIDALAAHYLQEALPPPEHAYQRACRAVALMGRLREVVDERLNSLNVADLFERVEMPLVEVIRDMERAGIAVDCPQLERLGEQIAIDQHKLSDQIYELAGCGFNINSPQQVGEVLFEKLDLPGGRRTKTGWSTAADVLEDLQDDYEIAGLLLEYRELAKLHSTYIKALLGEVDPATGRIHTTFEQTVVATGRLSSRNPNLQNIPKRTELGRRVRACFVAQPADHVLLCADYSQIELRILAHLSGDKNLVDAFNAGEDIHRRTAAVIFDLPIEQISDKMRSAAKTVNYAVIYGMGAGALSAQLDISRKEADKFIEDYFRQLPGVQQYMNQIVEQARQDGYVETICGRRRPMPDLDSNNRRVQAYAERAAANTPLQGSAADIIKIAMVDVAARLKQESPQVRMLLQVHDELIFEVAQREVAAVARLVTETMEGAWKLHVPLSVDVKVGKNWRDLSKVP